VTVRMSASILHAPDRIIAMKRSVTFAAALAATLAAPACGYVRSLGTLSVNSLIWDGGSIHDERRTRHSTQT
jgi:hypothetical protein